MMMMSCRNFSDSGPQARGAAADHRRDVWGASGIIREVHARRVRVWAGHVVAGAVPVRGGLRSGLLLARRLCLCLHTYRTGHGHAINAWMYSLQSYIRTTMLLLLAPTYTLGYSLQLQRGKDINESRRQCTRLLYLISIFNPTIQTYDWQL